MAVSALFAEAGTGFGAGCLLALIAVGVWLIIHTVLWWGGRLDVEDYNLSAGGELTPADIRALGLDEERTKKLLAHRERSRKMGAACAVIMMGATVVALLWLFLGTSGGLMDDGLAGLFWMPWMIGGICCGIAAVIVEARGRE